MSVDLKTLEQYCNSLLKSSSFKDYCPNGLQVEGKTKVQKIVAGVTACQALLDAAVAVDADLILVHHGYFWRSEDAVVVGVKKRRLQTLLKHDISLLAYHLPLDAHDELGNNTQLAKQLAWEVQSPNPQTPQSLVSSAVLTEPLSGVQLALHLERALQRKPLHIAAIDRPIAKVAWCTGAAQGYIEEAVALGCDAFISGEISESTVHMARELGIDYFAAGHHATERYGVQALGEHLAQKFALDYQFIDVPNPV